MYPMYRKREPEEIAMIIVLLIAIVSAIVVFFYNYEEEISYKEVTAEVVDCYRTENSYTTILRYENLVTESNDVKDYAICKDEETIPAKIKTTKVKTFFRDWRETSKLVLEEE